MNVSAGSNILIVEDEVLIAEHLFDILTEAGYSKIKLAHDKAAGLLALRHEEFSLALLDIRMDGELSGVELADEINKKHKIPFIFITAHSDRNILNRALETKPLSYITKPFKKMDVIAAVNIADSNRAQQQEYLTVKDGWSVVKIDLDSIIFAQSDGNYIIIQTTEKRHVVRYTLDWFQSAVTSDAFFRIHRTTIVNLNHVDKVQSNLCYAKGFELPVSRANMSEVKESLGGINP